MSDLAGFAKIIGDNIRVAMAEAEADAEYRAASPAKKFEIDRKHVAMQKWQELWSAHIDAGGNSRDPKFWKNWRGIEVSDGEVREYRNERRWGLKAAWGTAAEKAEAKKRMRAKFKPGKTVFVHMNGYPEDDGTGCPLADRTF